VNVASSFYARGDYLVDLQTARMRVAAALGVEVDEIAFTRGATEALQSLIGGYNRLRAGDTVLYADVDYPGMQYAMKWLADRRGVRVVRVVIPEPATRDNVVAAYAEALARNPGVRLLLLTLLNKTGLVLPVAASRPWRSAAPRSSSTPRTPGADRRSVRDLGADFIGFNLIADRGRLRAPLYSQGRVGDIDRMMADEDQPSDSIFIASTRHGELRCLLTVPAALDFHGLDPRARLHVPALAQSLG
jgi:hypothetical protein